MNVRNFEITISSKVSRKIDSERKDKLRKLFFGDSIEIDKDQATIKSGKYDIVILPENIIVKSDKQENLSIIEDLIPIFEYSPSDLMMETTIYSAPYLLCVVDEKSQEQKAMSDAVTMLEKLLNTNLKIKLLPLSLDFLTLYKNIGIFCALKVTSQGLEFKLSSIRPLPDRISHKIMNDIKDIEEFFDSQLLPQIKEHCSEEDKNE